MTPFVPVNYSLGEWEVVIVGDGIAGLSCALLLAESGIKPLVVTRGKGNTYLSQGGIAAVASRDDSPYLHYLDTLKAGRLLNDPLAVKIAVYEGQRAILKLTQWGVDFDKNETFFELALEGGHSKRRIFKVKDYTGKAIYETLHRKAKELKIPLLKGELEEIYTSEGKVVGALVKTEKGFEVLNLKVLVLAVGGASSLYLKNTNIQSIGGETLGTALRAGVKLIDTEFIQFHPTVLKGTKYLISEAVRGEGAILINEDGERFVNELAPRDEVARAIYYQMKNRKDVFLDFRPLTEKGIKIEEKFPQIWGILRENGFNPYEQPIPIEPSAHYFIGGIAVDTYGRTSVENLYAVGECACTGMHGANRLASNSLLEGIVFALRTAEDIALKLPFVRREKLKLKPTYLGEEVKVNSQEVISRIQNLLWEKAGIVRNGVELKEALKELNEILTSLEGIKNRSLEGRKLFDLTLVAKAIVLNALRRQESRGAHYREDFPFERETYGRMRFEVSLEEVLKTT